MDLQGVAAMGGVVFFNLAVEVPEGNLELLEAVLEGANVPVDESAEERKGGAGDLGAFRGAKRGGRGKGGKLELGEAGRRGGSTACWATQRHGAQHGAGMERIVGRTVCGLLLPSCAHVLFPVVLFF